MMSVAGRAASSRARIVWLQTFVRSFSLNGTNLTPRFWSGRRAGAYRFCVVIVGAAVVKAYEWCHDVLYGPYIKADD
jgi:hypothetical protein